MCKSALTVCMIASAYIFLMTKKLNVKLNVITCAYVCALHVIYAIIHNVVV